MQTFFTALFAKIISTLGHNWVPLSLAILISALMKVYIDPKKLKTYLLKRPKISILGSVALGAFTPLCACGTSAVIIAMLTTTLPWGPIMAFLTSSPLMSPEGFIMLAGIIDLEFAIALTLSSIIIGLGAGYITHLIEQKTDFLKNQVRFSNQPRTRSCGCTDSLPAQKPAEPCACPNSVPVLQPICCEGQLCCSGSAQSQHLNLSWNPVYSPVPALFIDPIPFMKILKKIRWREILSAVFNVGIKQILFYYTIFVAVGFIVSRVVPTNLIITLFSARNIFAVPLAALIGLPVYISGESSIPLIQALMEGGASRGAMLAFMITGAGTSAWVIAGIATFMKKRVIGLYISFLLAGGIVLGILYDILLTIGL